MTDSASDIAGKVPDHVPPELVHRFDFRTDLGSCPHAKVAELHTGPRIFYTPVSHQDRAGEPMGSWVPTKAEDIRYILQHTELFTSGNPRAGAMGESWPLIPLEVDPPEHGKYRMPLNPLFSPKRLKLMDDSIRNWAVELIERFQDKDGCDFLAAFAEPFSVGIFLDLLGMPKSDLPRVRDWANAIVHDRAGRGAAMLAVKNFLADVIAERTAEPEGDDLVRAVIRMEIDGRPLTSDEVMGIVFLLFLGGLDTVVSSLGYHFRYLAEHPDEQARLRAEPDLIPDAVEELFRAYPVVTTSRFATQDTEFAGVTIKKGDMITASTLLSTRDPDEFSDPNTVDFARSPNRHNAFSFGPHRCLGSHLARREIQIAVEECMRRLPSFQIAPGAELTTLGGGVMGMETLPLIW